LGLDNALHLREHAIQVMKHLAIEEAQDPPSVRDEGILSITVLLEGRTAAVIGEAIEFDDQTRLVDDDVGAVAVPRDQPGHLAAHPLGTQPVTDRLVQQRLGVYR
jgi:hypothetical protein